MSLNVSKIMSNSRIRLLIRLACTGIHDLDLRFDLPLTTIGTFFCLDRQKSFSYRNQ